MLFFTSNTNFTIDLSFLYRNLFLFLPGLYIAPNDKSVPEEFRGIGIRVEDDVLITDGEPVVLTEACVKEVDDIEAIVGKHSL